MPRRRSALAYRADPGWHHLIRIDPKSYWGGLGPLRNAIVEELAGWSEVEVEIGCGSGDFLLAAAKKFPAKLFVGVECSGRFLRSCRDRLVEEPLPNVLLICTDARLWIQKVLPDQSIHAFHIYFPDPWPKASQRKRRFLSQENLGDLLRTLKKGGQIYFVTDHPTYAAQAADLFRQCSHVQLIRHETLTPQSQERYAAYDLSTHYGERFRRTQQSIYVFHTKRVK